MYYPTLKPSKKMTLNIDPPGRLNQWLAHKELKGGVQRDTDKSAKLFVDNQKELELLANTFRSNSTLIELSRIEEGAETAVSLFAH
jgi:hypothetical protein